MKNKFNWLGFIALLIWDFGFIQLWMFLFGMNNLLFDIGNFSGGVRNIFNIYYIVLFICVILFDLTICRHNRLLIALGVINLIWYGVAYQFNVYPFPIVGCVLIILAGIYGLHREKKEKLQTTADLNSSNATTQNEQ